MMTAYGDRLFSFEFFPPKTPAGKNNLRQVQQQLAALKPHYCSVTYGAGGSTRDNTRDIVLELNLLDIPVAPHISFGGDSEEEMAILINSYKAADIKHIVALRGDLPSGMGHVKLVYANELVQFIRKISGDHFQIHVAAYPEIHPQALSYDSDIKFLKGKFDAGANTGITQYFYNSDAYFYFIDQCEKIGITAPIYPGIMPIANFSNLVRFSANCGAEIPRWIRQRIESYGEDQASIKAFGIEVVSQLAEKLLQHGAPGLHFYTMNQADLVLNIWDNLRLPHHDADSAA